MKRMAWICFAHLLLVISPGANAKALQQTIAAPANFAGALVSSESIQWSWNPVLGSSTVLGATHYDLHDPTHNLITTIAGPGSGSVTFVESGLSPGTYTRHVHAVNGVNTSAASNPATVTIPSPPPVPCTVSVEGAAVVMVNGSADVLFKAVPGDGQWDSNSIKITSPKYISTKVLSASPVTMRVRVTGKKKSKKIGDATFEATYICKDGSKQTASWAMTVIGSEDRTLSLTVVAVPPEPDAVNVLATKEFDFNAYPPITATGSVVTFASLSDNGDESGINSGDVSATTPGGIPQVTDSIQVEVDGLKNSRKIDDVIVTANADATFILDGTPSTAQGTGHKAFTVGPLRDHQDTCHWTVSGPSGITQPGNGEHVETALLNFEAAAGNTGKLKWRSLLTPDPSRGVKAHIVQGLNTPKMKIQVTVKESAFPSLATGDLTITCQYECDKGDGLFEFGVASFSMTLYRLSNSN